MNNLWVADLIDVGYTVSSQPTEGPRVRCQTPKTLRSWLQRVWSGLDHIQTQTLSLSNTHTHTHANLLLECVFQCSQTGTHRVLCAAWRLWALGGGQAWLSTPVFAAVIGGACYFEAVGVHELRNPAKYTEGALNGWGVRGHVRWRLLRSNMCFLWLQSLNASGKL